MEYWLLCDYFIHFWKYTRIYTYMQQIRKYFLFFCCLYVYLSATSLCLAIIDFWGILSSTRYNRMLFSYKQIIQPSCLPSFLFLLPFFLPFFLSSFPPSFLISFLSYVLKPGILYHAYAKHQRWLVQTGDRKIMKHFWNPDRKWLFLFVDLLMLTTSVFFSFLKNWDYLGTCKNTEAK